MNQIKFRAWNERANRYSKPFTLKSSVLNYTDDDGLGVIKSLTDEVVEQFTGLQDKNGVDFYVGCIGEFPNGDRFIVKIESWLEIYIDWIGEPECEDQARDLCRISNAKIIGTIHQNPELIKL
jgi:hypothetical protein